MAGLLIKELIIRGDLERCLVMSVDPQTGRGVTLSLIGLRAMTRKLSCLISWSHPAPEGGPGAPE
jgi:hypothetical protein